MTDPVTQTSELVGLIAAAMEASGKAARRLSWNERASVVLNIIERSGYEIRGPSK